MKKRDRAGLGPETLALPGAPQAERARRLRRRDPRPGHHLDPAARAARDRRQHDHHADRAGRRRCSCCSSGLAAINFFFQYIRRYSGGRYGIDVQNDLRNALFERLQRLDFARHDELPTGQLVSRASSDLQLVQQLLQFMPMLTGNVVLLVLSLFFMLLMSPLLTLLTLLDRSGAAHRVAAAAQEDVPGAVGLRCSAPARSPVSSTKPSPVSASSRVSARKTARSTRSPSVAEDLYKSTRAQHPDPGEVLVAARRHPRVRPGRRARARRLPRDPGRDHARHVPRLRHLPRAAARAGADDGQHHRGLPTDPRRAPSASSTSSTSNPVVTEKPDASTLVASTRARSSSSTSTSATCARSRCSPTSRCASRPARPSRSSACRVRASRR